MSNLFRWVKGRQEDCKYSKFTFWMFERFGFGTDSYLIHYQPNTTLPAHNDPVEGKKHYRLNIELLGRGIFVCTNVIFQFGPIVLFRPDIETHSMINMSSHRWIFSIGWAINESS